MWYNRIMLLKHGPGVIVVHVTTEDNVEPILTHGLRGPSCWSTDEKVVASYTVVTHNVAGKSPAWFMTSLNLFDESTLHPDMPSIYEPLIAALDMSEDEVADRWSRAVVGNWRDTLRIVRSLVISTHIPPNFLMLVKSPKAMIDQLQRQRVDDILRF
jgi:hypothetical protein